MDNYTLNKLQTLLALKQRGSLTDKSQTIDLLSQAFLETPYVANRLIGSGATPEQLVIDFHGLDCFTYLDYIQALRTASNAENFVENVIHTRYVGGNIDFQHRKHFFTDWAHTHPVLADDITTCLSPVTVTEHKQLNAKADGDVYLPGLPVIVRLVSYIPGELINEQVINQLQTGDLIGIYTPLQGLDVTHTGFFIMTPEGAVLRHASSRKENMKVINSKFSDYVCNTPGIVVLRLR